MATCKNKIFVEFLLVTGPEGEPDVPRRYTFRNCHFPGK